MNRGAMQISELSLKEMKEVFDRYFKEAFPRNEIRPWRDLEKHMDRGCYVCYGNFDEKNELCTYAFFFRYQNVLLLDYLASVPGKRSLGLGGRFLQELLQKLEGTAVLGEVEDPGANAAADDMKSRRMGFYRRNGFSVSGVCSRVYGQTFRIIQHGFPGTDEELAGLLKKLYPALMSRWRSRLHVKVWTA